MFPGMKITEFLPPLLPEPMEVEMTFIGGPFDGHKSVATVKRELTDGVTVTMKRKRKKYLYRYAGNNTFQYESDVE